MMTFIVDKYSWCLMCSFFPLSDVPVQAGNEVIQNAQNDFLCDNRSVCSSWAYALLIDIKLYNKLYFKI